MPRSATIFEILIASPSDVVAERNAIRNAIHEWNIAHSRQHRCVLLPVMWETHTVPGFGERPQAIVNQQIVDTCDALVGTFWTRLGSPTGAAPSGTVEEIERIHASGREVILYFSNRPVPPNEIDDKQLSALRAFQAECRGRGLYHEYSSHEDLSRHLTLALTRLAEKLMVSTAPASPEAPPKQQHLVELRQMLTRWKLGAQLRGQGIDACKELMHRYVDWYVENGEAFGTNSGSGEVLSNLAGHLAKFHTMGPEPTTFFFEAGEAVLTATISLVESRNLEPSLDAMNRSVLTFISRSNTKDRQEDSTSIAAGVEASETQVQERLVGLEQMKLVRPQRYLGGRVDYGLTGTGYVRAKIETL